MCADVRAVRSRLVCSRERREISRKNVEQHRRSNTGDGRRKKSKTGEDGSNHTAQVAPADGERKKSKKKE